MSTALLPHQQRNLEHWLSCRQWPLRVACDLLTGSIPAPETWGEEASSQAADRALGVVWSAIRAGEIRDEDLVSSPFEVALVQLCDLEEHRSGVVSLGRGVSHAHFHPLRQDGALEERDTHGASAAISHLGVRLVASTVTVCLDDDLLVLRIAF